MEARRAENQCLNPSPVENLFTLWHLHTVSLAVLNDGEQGPTFQTANGSSYIDVTLVTERTSGKINSWRLIRNLVITSHALLETLVGRGNVEEQPVRRWSQRGYVPVN